MRLVVKLLIVAVTLGAAASANAAVSRPVNPSLKDCVSAWNVSPGVRGVGAVQHVRVEALETNTGEVSWGRRSSVDLRGPGCVVWIVESPRHVVVVYKPWTRSGSRAWHKPVAMDALPGGEKINALVGSNGMLELR